MAEEKEKAEGAEEPKKSKTLIIIIAVVLVILLAVGGALFFLMSQGGEEDGAEGGAAHTEKSADKKKKASHAGDDLTMGPVFAVDNLVVNLMSEGGARYAKFSMALELDAQELAPEMLAKKALVSDIIITVISSKTAEELMNLKGKETAKNEIMEKVNERLKDGRVKNVYFTNFVVQ